MEELDSGYRVGSRLTKELIVQKEVFVKDYVTYTITQKVGVEMRKPRWMPYWLYHWLWKTVILTEYEDPIFRVFDEKDKVKG